MFAPYLLIHRIGGDAFRLIGKPRVGYLGSHVIQHRKVPISSRRTRSFAGAASVPEFATIKRRHVRTSAGVLIAGWRHVTCFRKMLQLLHNYNVVWCAQKYDKYENKSLYSAH
jgi:hypothetical protein